jgi:hypothetical protein
MTAATITRCLICERPLTRPVVGRPPRYCGVACRKAAELWLRRLQRRLQALEDRASDVRLEIATAVSEGQEAHYQRELDALADEIELMQARLRELLAEEEAEVG